MAKKKSLFKKLRKSASSLVAEPEAPVDEAILEAIAKPKIEAPVAPAIVRKPYIAPKKTYPAKIEIEVNKTDLFGVLLLAKQAAIEDSGKSEYVGELYSIDSDEERVATYLFQAKLPGYNGWLWAVTAAKVDEASAATICDVVLLPGAKALLAPNWVPYSQRIQPGDIGVGDIVPTAPDDERLTPSYASLPEDEELEVSQLFEFGLGRARVLSVVGRDAASKRWYEGDRGPRAAIAKAAPKPCSSCGFFIPIAGSLRGAFGVCSNAISPEDARVVSFDHGCGAHSEALIKAE
ncbi:MAG: DUF3027 domain-containing protein [Candidatus Nanopelagicaceae bacterium]|nr:DUF3027 domain-containing protein [Candidatus Nanopelagicaceae bacterium]